MGPYKGKRPLGTKPPSRIKMAPTKAESKLAKRIGGWEAAIRNGANDRAFHKPGSKRAKGK